MTSISKLIFTPTDHQQSVPVAILRDGLLASGWLGAEFASGPAQSFFTGADFFKFITFMGCSPALRLEPANDSDLNFCFIHLNTELPQPCFRGHTERFVPRCPKCRHGISQWQPELERWQTEGDSNFACPHCGATLTLTGLNWREKASIGRCFIEVYSVYPHEGVPTPAFMTLLKTISGVEWKYFYEPG